MLDFITPSRNIYLEKKSTNHPVWVRSNIAISKAVYTHKPSKCNVLSVQIDVCTE